MKTYTKTVNVQNSNSGKTCIYTIDITDGENALEIFKSERIQVSELPIFNYEVTEDEINLFEKEKESDLKWRASLQARIEANKQAEIDAFNALPDAPEPEDPNNWYLAVFFKQSNYVFKPRIFEGTKKQVIEQLKEFYPNLVKFVESGKVAREVNNTQEREGGVYFIIEGKNKVEKFRADNVWINTVKATAEDYPEAQFHFIEAHRMHRKGNIKAFEKCMAKVNAKYPEYQFKSLLES